MEDNVRQKSVHTTTQNIKTEKASTISNFYTIIAFLVQIIQRDIDLYADF